jgi:signal transduction histidine kinase
MQVTDPRWDLTKAQHTVMDLRRLLRDLGAPEEDAEDIAARLRRISVQTDLDGRPYIYVPPLPAEMIQHLVRLLPAPPEPRQP